MRPILALNDHADLMIGDAVHRGKFFASSARRVSIAN